MKAKVQYNDLEGSAAADISDYYLNSLNEYLRKRYSNFDSDRFFCIGCKFYTSYGQYPSVDFICRDLVNSSYHLFQPKAELTLVEFFELFKRFSIVIGKGLEEIEVDENERMPLLIIADNKD